MLCAPFQQRVTPQRGGKLEHELTELSIKVPSGGTPFFFFSSPLREFPTFTELDMFAFVSANIFSTPFELLRFFVLLSLDCRWEQECAVSSADDLLV